MNNALMHIIKDDYELPDWYSMRIEFLGSAPKEYNVVAHQYIKDLGIIELTLQEDIYIHVPVASIREIKFDKNFTKVVELKKKNESQS